MEQAKKAALQLAKTNEKLSHEVETLKKENEDPEPQENKSPAPKLGRPIQKESDKPADFAKSTWLL
ncbi:MAG: hypothetical protein LDL41_16305 [Coleofasciculus sp. S288]|nr:hypothetical protein [Coleofasciculus sp. S288]